MGSHSSKGPPPSRPLLPAATYRLQLNAGFTFEQAAGLVDYLAGLGITDCYLSPVLTARPGSPHGYDVVDPSALNPELGGEAAFVRLAEQLRGRGLGLMVDVVPNHMCVTDSRNRWWQDVLAHGPHSAYAAFFDIEWRPLRETLTDKVLLPVLGAPFGQVLEAGELRVSYEEGAYHLRYFDHQFPLAPHTWPALLRPVRNRLAARLGQRDPAVKELEALLERLEGSAGHAAPRQARSVLRALSRLRRTGTDLTGAMAADLSKVNGRPGHPRSFARLQALLDAQFYRLAHWRMASECINYRRFFDVNELAGLRVEVPRVFRQVHRALLRLVAQGWITGLRIDHPDGLYDPERYLRELQAGCRAAAGMGEAPSSGPDTERPFYIVVEKILIPGEMLRETWPVRGTTGYEFQNRLNDVFVEPAHGRAFRDLYARFTGISADLAWVAHECKRWVMETLFPAELNRLARFLERIAEQQRHSRDFTRGAIREVLRETVAAFPVYRTYVSARGVTPADREVIERATEGAQRRNPHLSGDLFHFLSRVLLLERPPGLSASQRDERLEFVMRFQQFTGPVMAKGVEDTALYRVYPLASLNVVGGDPDQFGASVALFHQWNRERMRACPHGLSATSTHDSKRSEDVRARLNVLSEIPQEWERAIHRWRALNQEHKTYLSGRPVPDDNEEYLLYQILVGAWPLAGTATRGWHGEGWVDFPQRIQNYMQKALREAKLRTTWMSPNLPYEQAVNRFVETILDADSGNPFIADLETFIESVTRAGLHNGLSQTLLNITSPGVPDFYQGTELWDFSLVDPDNRRPVDFQHRKTLLEQLKAHGRHDQAGWVETLLEQPEDGRIKLYLIQRALNFRRDRRTLFAQGDYVPLDVRGERCHHTIALARTHGDEAVVVAVGRFFMALNARREPTGPEVWGDTVLVLPAGLAGRRFRDALTGLTVGPRRQDARSTLPLSVVFRHLPVALLEAVS